MMEKIVPWLESMDFRLISQEIWGQIFLRAEDDTCLIIDTVICNLPGYPYVAYTSHQNRLMDRHDKVFRFLLDSTANFKEMRDEISFFLSEDVDIEKVRNFGRNRTEQEPDPTLPEATFEECFIDAFGHHNSMALHREFAYVDMEGKTRYVDYALFGKSAKFAIELNGESFHHPRVIGPKRYRSQLFKQNSLVSDGFKVFRWSLNGMRDRERFALELKKFLSPGRPFSEKPIFKLRRNVKTFTLHKHQEDALNYITRQRNQGQRTFLLVLPTGTGKTEIFIEDIVRLKIEEPDLKALVMVPSRKLRTQTIARLKLRLPPRFQDLTSSDVMDNERADIFVQTFAWMHRHYYELPADCFNYIVVDEAHHAPARGLRNILEHFTPDHLLGVTATPDRLDQQRLEDIFGEYEPQITLEDAMQQGLVPPVRCYRIKSNIDLSEVRFNGKDFVRSDLQTRLQVPSRDQLIVNVLLRYFSGNFSCKQGVIFCVDISHARRMADLLLNHGIPAAAVDGKDQKRARLAQDAYDIGDIRFLCACDLLTEGWDAPQTSIIVMARPTFSRVLYTQQLGRGLRNYPGKEALYVLDVVDNYGAGLRPVSLHSLLKIPEYRPFEDLIKPKRDGKSEEITILDGIYEGERRIEPVDILSFEDMYGSYLNEEQLARELFVSTGTVKTWLRTKKIESNVQFPFGRRRLHFFNPDQVETIRKKMGLSEHNDETRLDDFKEFLEKRDYTFSYKIIFLLSFLKVRNDRNEAALPDILSLYRRFYKGLLSAYGRNERNNCPYNRSQYLDDEKGLQRNLLANPFEKFERKRFFYHCKDLNYIALDFVLAEKLTENDYASIREQMVNDLKEYYKKLDIDLSNDDYSFLLPEKKMPVDEIKKASLLMISEPDENEKYETALPYYPLSIAAGNFMESTVPNEPEAWFNVEGLTGRRNFSKSMFVAKVQGKSMEPVIPDSAYCLFSFDTGGTRNGKIVLASKADFIDDDTGASFTIKKYRSIKRTDQETGWRHDSIFLEPANLNYKTIEIPPEEADQFRIIAFFIEVLAKDDNA